MATVKVYDLDAINLSIAGILISAGGGDGGFVSLTMPENFGAKTGVHGDVVSYKMANEVADGTLTLLDPAAVNEDLYALFYADKDAVDGSGVGDFLLEDLNSNQEITGQCRLTKSPDIDKQSEVQNYEWKFQVFNPRAEYRERSVSP